MARIAVALSGGVDSAVAALLLREQGHELVGVSLLVWPDSRCCDARALDDARQVAARLGIPYRIYDVVAEFEERVVRPFCEAYLAGRTPNPCPPCNRWLKFGTLLQLAARDFGVERLATGHYARLGHDAVLDRWQLRCGLDAAKDQSYMLYGLSQRQLACSLFPLGGLRKNEVRRLAAAAGLAVAHKKESQDACFAGGDVRRFLVQRLGERIRPGRIVDRQGQELGRHPGVVHYTLGQRKGLGRGQAQPLYVIEINAYSDEIVAGPLEQTYAAELCCRPFSWVSLPPTDRLARCQVKIRYGATAQPASLEREGDGCRIRFDAAQPSITPGQVAAVYLDELLVGGGIIAGREE